jgi:TRAP-type C4-dicarboxylate transport system permease small subunit
MSANTGVVVCQADRRLDLVLSGLAAAPLLVILGLTFADVFARYAFASPITGSVEIIEFAMAFLIFAALPLVTRSRSHVSVSLMDGVFTGWMGRARLVFCDGVSAGVLGFLTWRLWVQASDDWASETATVVLGWLYAPLYAVMAVLAGLTCLIMACLTVMSLSGRSGSC